MPTERHEEAREFIFSLSGRVQIRVEPVLGRHRWGQVGRIRMCENSGGQCHAPETVWA